METASKSPKKGPTSTESTAPTPTSGAAQPPDPKAGAVHIDASGWACAQRYHLKTMGEWGLGNSKRITQTSLTKAERKVLRGEAE
jgi:hypothetical protein